MMGLQREQPSLLPRNMNMSSNWNHAVRTGTGDGEPEDGRISSRREGHQGGSPSDPLLSAGRFYPVQDNNDPDADDDSPIANYTGGTLQASPFSQQQPFAVSGGLQASAPAYNPVHGTPTAHNLPAQDRKQPTPNHPGHPLLHPGQPKADEQEQHNEPAAAGLDRKPYINDPDPFISPHLSVANSSEDEGTPAASAKRARTMGNTNEYYPPTRTPHHPSTAHLQPPVQGPYYSATWQQDDHFHHHHHPHHFGPPFHEQYSPPPIAVYNFGGNDQHAHGRGMHPPPPLPPTMPHPPSVPPSPLFPHQRRHEHTSMTPPSIPPRRSSRPSSRAAAADSREPVVNLPRSFRAARAGEATVQAMHPTEEELSECQTPRARQALETWYQRLTELHMFKNVEGHCGVPQQYPENRQLGVWVNKQRMEKKAHEKNMRTSLTDTKIANLNRLGFEWGKRKGDEAWNARFLELVEYSQTHGNCDVPTKYIASPALGRWVSTQRSQFKSYPNKHMTQDRVNALNDIGFRWSMMEQEAQQQQSNETTTRE